MNTIVVNIRGISVLAIFDNRSCCFQSLVLQLKSGWVGWWCAWHTSPVFTYPRYLSTWLCSKCDLAQYSVAAVAGLVKGHANISNTLVFMQVLSQDPVI